MTSRAFYRAATLLPFVGLAIAAAVARPSAELPAGWEWVYPTSVTRGLIVYAVLAAWLWRRLDGHPPAEVEKVIWWVPVWYVALSALLMLVLSLLRGEVGTLWSEHGGAIISRTAVHFAVGYGYLALVRVARNGLRDGGRLTDAAGTSLRENG